VLALAFVPLLESSTALPSALVTSAKPREPACEVLEHGHYVPQAQRFRYADAGSVTGERFEINDVRFVDQATAIPRTLGQRFGIRYRLGGLTQSSVVVTWRVVYPSPVRGNKRWEYSFRATPASGELVQHLLYDFNIASEMVAGRWDFQVLVDGRAACSFAFAVK